MLDKEKKWFLVSIFLFAILVVIEIRTFKEKDSAQAKPPLMALAYKKLVASSIRAEDSPFYKPYEPHVDVTPSARLCSKKEGLYLEGSFIYWQSKLNGFDLIGGTGSINVEAVPLSSEYDPGFKVGLGYDLNWDRWDLFANWTRLKSSVSQTLHEDDPSIAAFYFTTSVFPVASEDLPRFRQGLQKWHMHFDAIDLEIGRNFFIGRNLSVRSFAGVKSGWIDYQVTQSFSLPEAGPDVTSHFNDNIWGIGPRLGASSRWILGRSNVAISAHVAGSLLYEFFHPLISSNIASVDQTMHSDHQDLEPVVELFLGVDWGICTGKRVDVNLGAGYEAQLWLNQQQQFIQGSGNQSTNLSFQGLTFNFKLGF